jgi:TPR repeat protein
MVTAKVSAALALALVISACGGGAVTLRPGATCDGGNVKDCRTRCDQNEGRACYRLGWYHEEGVGVGHDIDKAISLYDRACTANYAVACRALGIVYWQGEEVDRRPKKAIAYYQKACALGISEACPTDQMVAESEGRKLRPGEHPASGGISVSVGKPKGPDAPDAPQPPPAPTAPVPEPPAVPGPPAAY